MSPIPFARNIGKMDSDEPSMNDSNDNDKWSRFIPTPLINQKQKTKSFR